MFQDPQFLVAGVMIAFGAFVLWYVCRPPRPKAETHEEGVQRIFAALEKGFEKNGLMFQYGMMYRRYEGWTAEGTSGCQIGVICHLRRGDLSVELKQTGLGGEESATCDQRARRLVHEGLEEALMASTSIFPYFGKHELSALEEAGSIERLAAKLTTTLRLYDRIWAELETRHIQNKIACAMEFCDETCVDHMVHAGVVIKKNLAVEAELEVG